MANELEFPDGFPVTLEFRIDDVQAGGITDGKLASNLTTGFVVPSGHEFHPVCVSVYSNAARTGGTATVKVTDNGTELTGGPEATIDGTNTQKATGVQRVGPEPIAAGHVVGVSATGDASWAPTTADFDVVLLGFLLPA